MGLYTLLAAKWVGDSGKVYAFEPATQARARLERNVVLNQLRNVTIVPIALTEKASMSKLLVATDERDGHHTLGSFYDAEAVLNHVEDIRTEKLDDWFQMYNPWRVDVIKIDVEGAEMKMILGAQEVIQRFRPLLLMEISDATLTRQGSSRREVVECLREMRYTVRFLYKGRLLNPGEAPAEAIQGVAEPIMAN
jgi:FkbM family methyltransferase